jgi:hypothetical protein
VRSEACRQACTQLLPMANATGEKTECPKHGNGRVKADISRICEARRDLKRRILNQAMSKRSVRQHVSSSIACNFEFSQQQTQLHVNFYSHCVLSSSLSLVPCRLRHQLSNSPASIPLNIRRSHANTANGTVHCSSRAHNRALLALKHIPRSSKLHPTLRSARNFLHVSRSGI